MPEPHLSEREQNGVIRLYAVVSEWDKAAKKSKKAKQVYIGCKRADGSTSFNEKTVNYLSVLRGTEYERRFYQWQDYKQSSLSSTPEKEKSASDIVHCVDMNAGVSVLLNSVAEKVGMIKDLQDVFGEERANLILSLAYYAASTNAPLYAASDWSENEVLPTNKSITEQEICATLDAISGGDVLSFLGKLLKRTPKEHRLSLDITSVSSYSHNISDVMPGYNRDKEKLPQINLLMMVDQQSKLPVWFEELPGALADVSTLKDTVRLLKQIDDSPRKIVCDRAFGSRDNLLCLQKNGFKVTVGLPIYRNGYEDVRKILEEIKTNHEFDAPGISGELFDTAGAYKAQGVTRLVKWDGHRFYLHFFYCADYRVSNEKDLIDVVDRVNQLLKEGKEPKTEFEKKIAELCFTVKKTRWGLSVQCDTKAVDQLKEQSGGYFVICSNEYKNCHEALYAYKLRDGIEKRFDDLKNDNDCRRLRVHTASRMRARLFIQFLAEILRCYLLERKQNGIERWSKLKINCKTVNDIIRAMSPLRYIHIEGHHPFYKRPTRKQLLLMNFYGIPTTSELWWPSLGKN